MTLLRLDHLSVSRGGQCTLDDVSLSVQPGECVGLIGPNGAGKTTLMRAALGLIAAQGQSSLASLSPGLRAVQAAWLAQARHIAWPMPVADLVALGAQARGRSADHPSVAAALTRMGLDTMRARVATQLSGGEQARVLIARALAQDTPLLMVDEPTAGLDPAQAIRTMRVLRDLADEGRGVMVSLHDLGLAARYCTRLIVMQAGRIVADGTPMDVLTDALMATVFSIRMHRIDTEDGLIFQATGTTAP